MAVWLVVWLRLSWPAVQDDAFIHLRYAVNLLHVHKISYDGIHSDYGTSSLLYVWLLASLRALFLSPVLPRAVSSIFHLTLFAGLAMAFSRALRPAPRLAWGFALILLAILVTPMAVRWLDDGMETSLTLCMISLLAFSISRLCHTEAISRRSFAWLLALGFVITLARVEFLLLMTLASCTLALARIESPLPNSPRTRLRLIGSSSAPMLGGLAAAGLIELCMHSLVPDTAIAKANAGAPWFSTLHATSSVFASAMSMGTTLLLFWILTASAVIVYKRRVSLSMLAANLPLPIVLVLVIQRGQEVQGIRYFVWTLLYPILWNILELRWSEERPPRLSAQLLKLSSYGVVCLLLVAAPIESVLLYREFGAREHSLAQFRMQHLERLRPLKLVAFDVGYVGYFTQSPLCDMAGLVNGRASAALPFEDRVKACAAEHPDYAFVSGFSLWELSNDLDLKGWSICSEYDLANLRAADWHYLIASPEATAAVCKAAGQTPIPLETVLHPASP